MISLWHSTAMIKRILGMLFLGLVVMFGCSPGPVREQMDASLPETNAAPIDLNAALTQAKTEHKLVFMDFTGSDWCPPCMELHKAIFSQPEFQAYAQTNLVLLVVDFPSKFHLPPAAGATNDFLAGKFDVEGFPTLVALNGDGKEIWRHLGGIDGGPRELIANVQAAQSKAK
jgi:thiol:disulfide interchange protein